MYRLEREEFVSPKYISLWATLGFQAGYINAFGFLACERFVSHVTGFGTQVGISIAKNSVFYTIEMMGFPLSFILGAFLSGLITAARLERGLKPRFDVVTMLLPLLILLLITLGAYEFFGPFGEGLLGIRDFVLLYLLSLICGAQNGCFAVLTKGQIRTTHLTGISTDIGTDFARIWFGKLNGKDLSLTRRVNFSRIATFSAFSCGSIASVLVSRELEYGALVLPLLTSSAISIAMRAISRGLDRKYSHELGVA